MEESIKCNIVKVEPFIHQVGGHSSLLCLDEGTICKPLVARELEFYETLPEALRRFTPKFYGVVQIHARQEGDGYVSLVANLPDSYQLQTSRNNNNNENRIRIRQSGSIEVDGNTSLFTEDQTEAGREESLTAMNPWVLKCHRTGLQSIISQSTGPNFILLENLACNLVRPCILDLKMGTRHYDDMASLPKKQSKLFKVMSTTSGKLGARLGGMQVYQQPSRRYLCRNKFYGRSLSVGGFQQALRQFLHNGSRLRTDVLAPLVRRLEDLARAVACTDAVRFYTTSLLLIYEGDDTTPADDGAGERLSNDGNDMMNVDVENDSSNIDNELNIVDNELINVDNEALMVDNGSKTFDEGSATRGEARSSNLEVPEEALKRCASAEALTRIVEATDLVLHGDSRRRSTKRRRSSTGIDEAIPNLVARELDDAGVEPRVDVRIIDFAHSTHKAIEHECVAYSGPDRGFLFGLENLIEVLKSIERDRS